MNSLTKKFTFTKEALHNTLSMMMGLILFVGNSILSDEAIFSDSEISLLASLYPTVYKSPPRPQCPYQLTSMKLETRDYETRNIEGSDGSS